MGKKKKDSGRPSKGGGHHGNKKVGHHGAAGGSASGGKQQRQHKFERFTKDMNRALSGEILPSFFSVQGSINIFGSGWRILGGLL